MLLTSWDKFLILIGGGVAVIVTIIIVSCFVGPGCWGFEYLMQREKKKKMMEMRVGISFPPVTKVATQHTCENGGDAWTNGHPGSPVYPTDFVDSKEEKFFKFNNNVSCNAKEKAFNMKCTPLMLSRRLYPKMINSFPKLKIKLVYSNLKNNDLMARLGVHVLSASSLPCREYVSTVDPYVCLDIFHGRWPFFKAEKNCHSVQTRVIKNDSNPIFDQVFSFDGLKREIQNWCLKFTVLDNDRLTKITPLFEKRIFIRDVKELTCKESVLMDLSMQETSKNIGNLLFGIRYLPTSQRFNINVIKASKLKYQSHVPSLLEFYPFVRVVMLNGHGKCIKKKKTGFRQGEFSPIFNQSFIFDLSIANLEQTVFLILLCTKTMQRDKNDSEDTVSLNEDAEGSLKEKRDKVLGTIVLGRNVKCNRARNHWVSVMRNPRKMISLWHELR